MHTHVVSCTDIINDIHSLLVLMEYALESKTGDSHDRVVQALQWSSDLCWHNLCHTASWHPYPNSRIWAHCCYLMRAGLLNRQICKSLVICMVFLWGKWNSIWTMVNVEEKDFWLFSESVIWEEEEWGIGYNHKNLWGKLFKIETWTLNE